MVADKGLGPHQMQDVLAMAGDFIDWVKIASSSARLSRPDDLRRKIADYDEAAVEVLLTGDFLETAVMHGLADQVYAEARSLGFTGVEVATAQTILSVKDKATLVRRARGHGLTVFAEVGRKGQNDRPAHAGRLVAEAEQLLAAGAEKVLVQGEGICEGVPQIDEDVLLTLASRIPMERTVFQAKETRAQTWFISTFGPQTSMDVDVDAALTLELMRRGIRQRGLFALVGSVGEAPELEQ